MDELRPCPPRGGVEREDAISATGELRRMLDERGIEYEQSCIEGIAEYTHVTKWKMQAGNRCTFYEIDGGYPPHFTQMFIETPTAAQAIDTTMGPQITEDTSDGYHTFNELYHHRAVLFSVIVHDHRDIAWKSRRHHDGTMYDGMFIVGIQTPSGQATYHYDIDPYWDTFDCDELDHAPEWDGHTPDEALARIAGLRELDSGRGTCEAVVMNCAGNPPYNASGLSLNFETVGCSECGAPWPVTLYRHGAKACPFCGRWVAKQ